MVPLFLFELNIFWGRGWRRDGVDLLMVLTSVIKDLLTTIWQTLCMNSSHTYKDTLPHNPWSNVTSSYKNDHVHFKLDTLQLHLIINNVLNVCGVYLKKHTVKTNCYF